ncbi:MAG TPA: Uma2 family endonuclease [Pirellulales bacterium]|jgi:Uma2 family endonuclease|nr:Uma2 family endonuclease [Pirellulales bacterium]
MATAAVGLLTAEEYFHLPDPGYPTELERGVVLMMSNPGARHGQICAEIAFALKLYLMQHNVGRVVTNDAGVITERAPDTVRGPDIAYYSYQRIPQEQSLPAGYPAVPPDLAFEVMSPSDRWKKVLAKVAEFLQAGVLAVCIVDPDERRVSVYSADAAPRIFAENDLFNLPPIFPDFAVPVKKLFAP